MHLDQVLGMIRNDRDPVAGHPVAPSLVSLEIVDMPRRVDELQPLGNAEQHGPARAAEKGLPAQRLLKSQTTSAKSIRPLPL